MWTGAKGNEWFHGGGGEWTAGGARVDDPGDVQDHNKRPDARLLGRNLQYFLPKVRHQPPGVDKAPLRSVRMVARNSGLFYLSATHEALRLMEVLAARMASEDVWDQSAYNMEIFRPSYGNCTHSEALEPQTNRSAASDWSSVRAPVLGQTRARGSLCAQ